MLPWRRPKVALRSVVFEVTPRCNLACRHCYNPWKRPGEPAPPDPGYRRNRRVLGRLLSQAALRRITLSGGEPMLAERLAELVLFLRLRGLAVTLITNGTLGEAEEWHQLVDLGVGLFELPVLGPDAATHDAVTAVPGSFDRTLATLRLLAGRGAGLCAVVVVSRLNLPRLEETLALVAGLGVRQVLLNRVNLGGLGFAHWRDLWLEPTDVSGLLVTAGRAARALGLRITSGVCTPLCAVEALATEGLRTPTCSADPARRPLTLDGWGTLRSCNHSPVALGDLTRRPLAGILASPVLARWAEVVPDACVGCARWEACLGGCRAAGEQLGCDLSAADPLLWPRAELEARLRGRDGGNP